MKIDKAICELVILVAHQPEYITARPIEAMREGIKALEEKLERQKGGA